MVSTVSQAVSWSYMGSFRRGCSLVCSPVETFNFRSCRLLKLLSDNSCEPPSGGSITSYRDPGSLAWNRFSAIPSRLVRMRNYQSSCPRSRSLGLILTAGLVSVRLPFAPEAVCFATPTIRGRRAAGTACPSRQAPSLSRRRGRLRRN